MSDFTTNSNGSPATAATGTTTKPAPYVSDPWGRARGQLWSLLGGALLGRALLGNYPGGAALMGGTAENSFTSGIYRRAMQMEQGNPGNSGNSNSQ